MGPSMDILWSRLIHQVVFVAIASVHCVEISPSVVISNWTLPGDKLSISCSISTPTQSDQEIYNVHLICPLIDGTSCYVNCNSQCVQEIAGGCTNVALKNAFYSCNYVRGNEKQKIDLYYQLNLKSINVRGQWLCQYGGIRSSAIVIDKYSGPAEEVSTTRMTSSITRTSALSTTVTTTISEPSFLPGFEVRLIIIIVASLAVSMTANIVLVSIVCITRKKFIKSRKKLKSRDNIKDQTETTSMLTRSSTHQPMLSRSNCSRTPSLDSPSFRESIATYLPDCSTVIPTGISNAEPNSYYIDQYGRLFGVMPVEGLPHAPLSRQSSSDSNFQMRPLVQNGSIIMPQSISTSHMGPYAAGWTHFVPAQHQRSLSSTRPGSSQQQIFIDSNDESGLGSQSFSNSAKQKNGSFHSGHSGKVDLILDCDPNNMALPPLHIP